MKYKHLSILEREKIQELLWQKKPALVKPANEVKVVAFRHCQKMTRLGIQHVCLSGVPGSSFHAPSNPKADDENFFCHNQFG